MILHNHSDRKAFGKNRHWKNWCIACRTWMLPANAEDRAAFDPKLAQANDLVALEQQETQ